MTAFCTTVSFEGQAPDRRLYILATHIYMYPGTCECVIESLFVGKKSDGAEGLVADDVMRDANE